MTDIGDTTTSRRQSWIGIDYFESLRQQHQAAHDHSTTSTIETRRIPAPISNILCLRWTPDGRHLAISTSDGCIGLYDAITGACQQFIPASASASPATSLRFRTASLPTDTVSAQGSVLAAAYTNGHLVEFNYTTGAKLRHVVEVDNQILALDYRNDSLVFATGGRDRQVRLYDELTGTLVRTLSGHVNRVFAVRCHPHEEHLVATGGWDDTVRIWDMRIPDMSACVALVYGPHICGDAVDLLGLELLTGSWADRDQVQIWDIRTLTGGRTGTRERPLAQVANISTMIYTAQFSVTGPVRVGIGGTRPNEMRVMSRADTGSGAGDGATVSEIGPELFQTTTDGSYTSQFSPVAPHEFAGAGAGNVVRIVDAQQRTCREISAVGFRNVPKW